MSILRLVRRWLDMMALVSVIMMAASCTGSGQGNGLRGTVSEEDSDAYYMALMQKHYQWYAEMNVDSMVVSSERIKQYLTHHQKAENAAHRRLKAEWLKARGVFFTAIKGMPDSGVVYTERALQAMQGLEGVDELRIIAMANRADFYRQMGQLDRSADGYLSALQVADSAGLGEAMKIPLLLGISTAYTFMGDYQTSRLWWQRTSELVGKMEKPDQFIYYNNLGNDYYFQQKYREALECFQKAASLVRDNEKKKWDYYTALTNLGEIYVCLGNADSARIYIQQADSFFTKVDFPPLLYYIETEKIELAMLEGRLADAMGLVNNGKYKEVTIPSARQLRLKAVEQVMQKTGNYRAAYEANKQLQLLNDSIQNANTRMLMSSRMMQYEHDKRLIEQQRTIDHERMTSRLAWALFTVALLAVGLLIMFGWLWRRRQRVHDLTVRQQIMSMRMENTRNRITPHFIYNALSHEMLAQMKGRKVDLNVLTQLLRRGVEQADLLETTLAEELTFIEYYIDIERQQMPQELHYHKEIANDMDIQAIHLPAMTIQIFVENAIKHGLRRQGGKLTIRASRQDHATLVEVIDNGPGIGLSYQEHMGLRIVRQTIQMLNEHNQQRISFGIGNIPEGCRSWLLIPDDYNYNIAKT